MENFKFALGDTVRYTPTPDKPVRVIIATRSEQTIEGVTIRRYGLMSEGEFTGTVDVSEQSKMVLVTN